MNKQPNPPRRATSTSSSLNQLSNGLGAIVSWQFHGKSWKPQELRSFVSSAYMDIDIKEIPVTYGMHNAISLFRDVSENGEPIKADKVHGDTDTGIYTIAILEREADTKNRRSKYDTIDKIVFDVSSKSFTFSGRTDHAERLCNEIKFRSEHYSGNEFRKWIIMPLIQKWNGIRIMGGAYYIGQEHVAELDKLEELCRLSGVSLNVLDQMNTPRTAKTIANAGKISLMDRLDSINDQLKKWKGRKRIRKDGSDNLLREIKDVIQTSKLIEDSLKVSLKDVHQCIEDATKEALSLIGAQAVKPVTSQKVLGQWSSAMRDEYKLGDTYIIPFSDIEKLSLPAIAKNPHYYKAGKRLCRALFELGYVGQIRDNNILILPL